MSENLFIQLEQKVEQALGVIEVLRNKLSEAEVKNLDLESQLKQYKAQQTQWESNISGIINKLDRADLDVEVESQLDLEVGPEYEYETMDRD